MTEHKTEVFLPQEVDEQIDEYLTSSPLNEQSPDTTAHTVQLLQRYFAPTEQDASLQRVWQRFEQQRATQLTSEQEQQQPLVQRERRYRKKQRVYNPRPVRKSLFAYRLNLIATFIFIVLLVGSMIVVFQYASHSHGRSTVSNAPQTIPTAPKEGMMFALLGGNTLYRLDINTRQPLWHFQIPGGTITSAEQIVGTTCYIAGAIGNDGKLYALDVASGKIRWQIDLSSPIVGYGHPLVISNDTLYLPSTRNGYPTVQAFAVSNGARRWESSIEGINQIQLLAASDKAIYGQIRQGGARFALSAKNGHLLWQKNEEIANVVAIDRGFVVDGVLFVVKNSGFGIVVGYNAMSGAKLWSHPLDGGLSGYGTTLLNGVVYVSTNRLPNQADTIYAFSAKDGTQLWHYQDTATSGSSYPMVTKQVVYFYRYSNGKAGQTLVALNTADGKERWTYDFQDNITVEFAPTADNNQVYLSLPNNMIQIVRATDGKPLGSFKVPGPVDPNNRVLLLVVEG